MQKYNLHKQTSSDVEAVHFCLRFRFQENLKTASASASMLPGDFHENIDEVKHYT